MTGAQDWTAGIPACNAAFFSGVKRWRLDIIIVFSCFALMQAGMPAVQSSERAVLDHQAEILHDLDSRFCKLLGRLIIS